MTHTHIPIKKRTTVEWRVNKHSPSKDSPNMAAGQCAINIKGIGT